MIRRETLWKLARTTGPWVLAAYWITLFVATHVPVPAGPPTSDKVIHFGAYAVLAGLFAIVLLTRRVPVRRTIMLTVCILCGYGVLDEVTQAFVDRHPDVLDALADWAGVVAGLTAALWLTRSVRSAETSTSGQPSDA